jgi:FkbM family methyltransferase
MTLPLSVTRLLLSGSAQKSYAQGQEDVIVASLLQRLGIDQPSYLDIGAYHPVELSNTYLFYQRGCRGVCVEPDPSLAAEIMRQRPRDVCLNVGVGVDQTAAADFYVMSDRAFNTFSKVDAEKCQASGRARIERIMSTPMRTINSIIEECFPAAPNFVSMDVEGLDLAILRTFDFALSQPEVFCVETLSYTEAKKPGDILDLMIAHGYFVYADTVNNTIFVHRSYWGRCRMADRLFITTVLGLQMAELGVRRAYRWSRQWVRNRLP